VDHIVLNAHVGATAVKSHLGRFGRPVGPGLLTRVEPFLEWLDARCAAGTMPASRVRHGTPAPVLMVGDDESEVQPSLNFASQDYLGLSEHDAVRGAALEALHRFGAHSAGSPTLLGNTVETVALERDLGEFLWMDRVLLFPSGWAAGFAAITALVREPDHVVLDERAHGCLRQGAWAATRNVSVVSHLDLAAVQAALVRIRERDSRNAILVVTEGLFPTDSDAPDLTSLQAVCSAFEATLLVDVAHDLGATGPHGLGTIGTSRMLGKLDLVVGSFAKTFATNGGFVAVRSGAVYQYLKHFSSPHVASSALSPMQAATARAALRLVRSPTGERARRANAEVSGALRRACSERGLQVLGDVSPVVPVVAGSNRVARAAAVLLARAGVLAGLVEYPTVPPNSTRFRFQVMATHSPAQATLAAVRLADAVAWSRRCVPNSEPARGGGLTYTT